MHLTVFCTAAACLLLTAPAAAAGSAFMTGTQNPYGLDASHPGSPEAAMVTNWGTNYDRFQGFDAAVFSGGYDFIYIEGSDVASSEFTTFMTSHRGALENYIIGGGRAFINAARTDGSGTPLNVGFGVTFAPGGLGQASASATVSEINDLGSRGAGTFWTGTGGQFFANEIIIGAEVEEVAGNAGTVFGWGYTFAISSGGYLFWGTQTAPAFHSDGGIALRVNELCRAGGGMACDDISTPVPEPQSWALMIVGFGLVGAALRRRTANTLTWSFGRVTTG